MAACEAGREPARFAGTVDPDVRPLLKVLAKAGDPARVSVVYEAGPTGYGLYRELRRRGYRCEIVAPSLIPRRPSDRVKNDRRDCARLTELSRAGELKPIWVHIRTPSSGSRACLPWKTPATACRAPRVIKTFGWTCTDRRSRWIPATRKLRYDVGRFRTALGLRLSKEKWASSSSLLTH